MGLIHEKYQLTNEVPTAKEATPIEHKPYSRNPLSPMNLKPRAVHCYQCDYTIVTDLSGPVCGECGCNLITVLNGELANRNSQST